VHQHLPKLSALLLGLSNKFPSPKVIIIHSIAQETYQPWEPDWVSWEDFVQEGAQHKLGRSADGEIEWHRLSFDAPLWVLFSSGTTGRPKCVLFFKVLSEFYQDRIPRPIVHRAGGMLLQAKKEFAICGDIRPDDVFFYYTTTFVSLSVSYPKLS
jgi:acetoacetyl-CoA synthetase